MPLSVRIIEIAALQPSPTDLEICRLPPVTPPAAQTPLTLVLPSLSIFIKPSFCSNPSLLEKVVPPAVPKARNKPSNASSAPSENFADLRSGAPATSVIRLSESGIFFSFSLARSASPISQGDPRSEERRVGKE